MTQKIKVIGGPNHGESVMEQEIVHGRIRLHKVPKLVDILPTTDPNTEDCEYRVTEYRVHGIETKRGKEFKWLSPAELSIDEALHNLMVLASRPI